MKSSSRILCLLVITLLPLIGLSPIVAQTAPKQQKKVEQESAKKQGSDKKDAKQGSDKKDASKKDGSAKKGKATPAIPAALNFKMKSIDGEEVNLSKYQGNVVLFVNVASKCGYTKQYKQLQELHDKYAEEGLSIVGIPCNQFGGQEPGTNEEIVEFCESKFGVEFDLMDKVDVKDDTKCELYEHLTGLDLKPKGKSEVRWNFEKFILDRKGQPIARFSTKVSPDSDEFVEVITKALAEQVATEAMGPYKHTNSKGKSYFLYSQDVKLKNSDKTRTSYFFAKSPDRKKGKSLSAVPEGWQVSETKSGMLVLKKSAKTKSAAKQPAKGSTKKKDK